MNRFKKNLFLLFTLFITLFGIFYLRNAFADWTSDTEPPTTTITATGTDCLTVPDPADPDPGQPPDRTITTCPNTTTVSINISCTDLISGCNSIHASKTDSAPPYLPDFSLTVPPNSYSPFSVTFSDGSPVIVSAYSIDNAGNTAGTSALQTINTINFVYNISGYIYLDNNKSNTRDAGDVDYVGPINIYAKVNLGDPDASAIAVDSHNCVAPACSYSLNVPPGSYYYISYTPPPEYARQYPPLGSFRARTGTTPPCDTGDSSGQATCSGGDIINLNFGMSSSVPWYQCIGADCRDDNGVDNPLPVDGSPPVSCNNDSDYPSNYASVKGPASGFSNDPGIIFSGSTTTNPNFGLGESSANEWVVGNTTYPEPFSPIRPKVIRTSYDYYQTTIKQNGISTTDLTTLASCSDLLNCTLTGITNGVYTAGSSVALNGYTFTGNKNYVILVKGDLTIKGNILVDIGSTATFSVTGDIKIDPLVGGTSTVSCNVSNHNGCHVEGFYSANKSFIIQGPSALRLNIAGAVVTNAGQNGGSVQNQRDIGAGNATCPTYTITERPDFILNSPDFLKHANFVWQEVAP